MKNEVKDYKETIAEYQNCYQLLDGAIADMQRLLDDKAVYSSVFPDLPKEIEGKMEEAIRGLTSIKDEIVNMKLDGENYFVPSNYNYVALQNAVSNYVCYVNDIKHQLSIMGVCPQCACPQTEI